MEEGHSLLKRFVFKRRTCESRSHLAGRRGDHTYERRRWSDHGLQRVRLGSQGVSVVHHLFQQLVHQAKRLLDSALVHVTPEVISHNLNDTVEKLDDLTYMSSTPAR